MKAIVCTSLDDARGVRDALDRSFGFPRPGYNPVTGDPIPPGVPGWTASIAEIFDIGGVVYVVGISDEIARTIFRASIDVEPAGFGTAYALEISGWNGPVPVLLERSRQLSPALSDLASAKTDALRILAQRAAAARVAGFTHTDGRRYALEHAALRQIMEAKSWADYDQRNATSYMAYPLVWPSIDRTGFVAMQNAADVVAFALACSLADRALTEQMAGLEMSIALATTVEDVAAVLATPVVP